MREAIQEKLRGEHVTVTDIPAGPRGVYNYGPGDPSAVKEYQNAAVGLMHAERQRTFWHRLALYVNRSRVARCHGCAAFAALNIRLVADNHHMNVFIAGLPEFDHHILFVTDVATVSAGDTINDVTQFPYHNSLVVDIWQYHLNRQQTGKLNLGMLAEYTQAHMYTAKHHTVKIYVQY